VPAAWDGRATSTGWSRPSSRRAVTKEMFTRWEDDSSTAAAVDAAAEKLKNI